MKITQPSTSTSSGGGVTSVGLSMPAMFTVSGSPVTTTGTLTATLANQSANTVFAGPATGAAAAPTFRALVAADIPALAYPTGTGIANYLARWTGASALSTGVTLDNGSTLGVNALNDNPVGGDPAHAFNIANNFAVTGLFGGQLTGYGTGGSNFHLRHANGTMASPTALTTNTALGAWEFRGYNGSAFAQTTATIIAKATENWTPTANGTKIQLQVQANGTAFPTARLDALVLENDGTATLPSLAGTGIRMVTASATGNLDSQSLDTFVQISGTPAANEVAFFGSTNTIGGNANFLYSGSAFSINLVSVVFGDPANVTAMTNSLAIGDTTSGSSVGFVSTLGGGAFAHAKATNGASVIAGGEGSHAFGTSDGDDGLGTFSLIRSNQPGTQAFGITTTGGKVFADGEASQAFGKSEGTGSNITTSTYPSQAFGHATTGGIIAASAEGSLAHGFAEGGEILASGKGSYAGGHALTGLIIEASGDGAFAHGLAETLNHTATNVGSGVLGADCTVDADYAWAIGQRITNSVGKSVAIGWNGATELFVGQSLVKFNVLVGTGSGIVSADSTGAITRGTDHLAAPASCVAGTGAGTSPTFVGAQGTETSTQIEITTGTLPAANAVIATVTLTNAWSSTMYPTFSPANAAAAALSAIFVAGTGTNTYTINSGATPLTGATTYKWNVSIARY